MTRPMESNELDAVVQLLTDYGFDGMARAIEVLMNEAKKLQRSEALSALHYQRTVERRRHANGFKPKRVNSRLGKRELHVPQTRGVEFYLTVLGAGRGERPPDRGVARMPRLVESRSGDKMGTTLATRANAATMQLQRRFELMFRSEKTLRRYCTAFAT